MLDNLNLVISTGDRNHKFLDAHLGEDVHHELIRVVTHMEGKEDQPLPYSEAILKLIEAAPDVTRALVHMINLLKHTGYSSGVCCCGDSMEAHANPMHCGHSPVDSGEYYGDQIVRAAQDALIKAGVSSCSQP